MTGQYKIEVLSVLRRKEKKWQALKRGRYLTKDRATQILAHGDRYVSQYNVHILGNTLGLKPAFKMLVISRQNELVYNYLFIN